MVETYITRTEEPMGSRQFSATSSGSNGGRILCMTPSSANRHGVFSPEFNILHKYLQPTLYLPLLLCFYFILQNNVLLIISQIFYSHPPSYKHPLLACLSKSASSQILYHHFMLLLESNKSISMFSTISSTILEVWDFSA